MSSPAPQKITLSNLRDVLRYHQPNVEEIDCIQDIRGAAEFMIRTILTSCPDCADRSAAIRHVREAMMTANAAIVLDGMV